MAKKRITREDFAGLRLLRPAEGKRADRMYAQGNDGYNPYGYDPEEYGYIKDGGTLPEVTVYGYYDSGDDGWKWSSGIPPWGDTDNPFIDEGYPGDESDIWFDIYGEDYYYYNSPYYGMYDTEVGGSPQENPRKNGVDVTNADHFFFENTKDYPAFHKQLTKILESNSALKELLAYFDNGDAAMILKIASIPLDEIGRPSGAQFIYDINGIYTMAFNKEFIKEYGWGHINSGVDETGFDWSVIDTEEKALVVVLTHEALHAHYYTVRNEIYSRAIAEGKNSFNEFKAQINAKGYPDEFYEMFVTRKDGRTTWDSVENTSKKMHDYMRNHDYKYFDLALSEYENDFN